MKLISLGMLFLFGCMCLLTCPGPNSAWAKAQGPNGNNVSDVSETEAKRIKECETANRPKPDGDIKKVSQLCGKALSLPRPAYPEEAKANRISGTVVVDIVTNVEGYVIWAKAISGPEELRSVAEKAACRARYSPTKISGRAIQTESSIQYLFVAP